MMNLGLLVFILLGTCSQALPKFSTADKGFVPSKGEFLQSGDQLAMESHHNESQERPPRYGFPTYSTDIQNTGNVVPGVYGPVKLDIGGLVLGTIVGLGAFFILPKILTLISPHGGFKRSEDGSSEGSSTAFGDIVNKIQDSLSSHHVDSTACMQRAVCSTVQSASERMDAKRGGTLDNFIDNVAKNDLVKTLMDGTEWRRAIETGQKGDSCSSAFTKCPFSVDSVVGAVVKYAAMQTMQ